MPALSRRLAALFALATVFSQAACKSRLQNIPPSIQLVDSTGAQLSSLTFPTTGFGGTSTETFGIRSLSTTPVEISAVTIAGSAQAFFTVAAVDGGAFPLLVNEGQDAPFAVTFAPVATPPEPQGLVPEAATLGVTSNDPVNGQLSVPLSGEAAAPSLSVCWERGLSSDNPCLSQGLLGIPFGDVPLGRGNSSQPAVIQIGASPDGGGVGVTVTSVTIDAEGLDAGYAFVSPIPTTPAALDAGGSLIYYIALFPNALGPANGNLIVQSNDPHFPPGSPPQIALQATVTPRSPPVACEGPVSDEPLTGVTISADAGLLGATWVPAPLDTITLTGIVDAGCSFDAVDPQSSLLFAFSLVDGGEPPGSAAKLQALSSDPAEATLQVDLVGTYQVSEVVTDRVGLPSTPAVLSLTTRPRDDIAAQLTWTASASQDGNVPMQVDLHLVRTLDAGVDSSSELAGTNDCWWVNCLGDQPSLAWGPGGGFGDPLVGTEFGQRTAPFPASPEDYTTLSGPQAGAVYDLYVWYFTVEMGEVSGACSTDADCTVAGYPHCSNNQCVPSANATLRAFVGGQDVTNGGLTMTLGKPCDLWHAGTLQWLGGGELPDGGSAAPQYTFTALDGGLTSDTTIGCVQ